MQMLARLTCGSFNISDYGKIIADGFGRKPDRRVKEELLSKYNFDVSKLF
jgi:hypothetical protein